MKKTRRIKNIKKNKKVKFGRQTKTITLLIIGGLLFLTLIFANYIKDLPSPKKLESQDFAVSSQILDRNRVLLYEIYSDTQRTPIPLSDIPQNVVNATLAIEDSGFYSHFGFSIQGIARATRNTLLSSNLQGGSTITQQLVKTTLLTPERTFERKIKEAILTFATEIIYSKDQILEMYLNHIPYGGTAYGIEAAAHRYFGKSATELNLAEASLLAGLPQAPTRYSPFTHPERAKARQSQVLRRMMEDGFIDAETVKTSLDQNLEYILPTTNIKAPHFVFFVKSLLEEKYGINQVERGGLRVTTTLDLKIQEIAQASVSAQVASLQNSQVGNGAALITKPNTGEILAMIGSTNYFDAQNDGQVNITIRSRQPGSSIKPLNYVTALQNKILHPSSILLDIPTCFSSSGQPLYCPKNYDGVFRGPVTFRDALANSYNIPAVKVLALNGLETLIATASAMGISTFNDPSRFGLSLTLGGGEVTMIDMATAFGTLANEGVRINLNPILNITDYTGKVMEEYDPPLIASTLKNEFFDINNPKSNEISHQHTVETGNNHSTLTRIINREPSFLINDILADNQARSAAFGSNSQLQIRNHTVAVKTGTTNDLKDNWTIGYTPEYLVVTWVGNNDNSSMNRRVVSGVTGAAPIWNDLMTQLLTQSDQDQEAAKPPPGIKAITVCKSGGGATQDGIDCNARSEYFWDLFLPGKSQIERKPILVYKDTGAPFYPQPNTNKNENEDSLEPREHFVVSDPFFKNLCLNCQAINENEEDGILTPYPRSIINMSSFGVFN